MALWLKSLMRVLSELRDRSVEDILIAFEGLKGSSEAIKGILSS